MESPLSDGGGRIEGEMVSSAKRRKKEEWMKNDDDDEETRRVAEIVLVLSAMGRMRGSRGPTMAEKVMMEEAREKVAALCQELAPKDVLPRDGFGVLMEDLGFSGLKEQRLGFRPHKLSISDKIVLTKRRMEESKAFVAQPAPHPSQRLQSGSGAAAEDRGTRPTVRVFTSDKVGNVPVPTGTFQPPTSAVYVSSAASSPIWFHPPGTEVRPPVVSSAVSNNVGRHSTSTVDRAHLRSEGRPNGPPMPHVPASSAANQHMVRTTPVHTQPQPFSQANVGIKNKTLDQLPVSARTGSNAGLSAPQLTAQAAVGQTPRPIVSQTAPGTLRTMHHPVQGMQFVQTPPIVNHHLEISKLVQKLLNPKFPPCPVWNPPSRDYMNRELPCQFCKLSINVVENMVVCDACEKGYHLGCLQSYNAKGIPRGEWHCPRCLAMSHGRPFPPKYGRVTRNMNAPVDPSSTASVQLPSEKKEKTVDENVNQPNGTTGGNPDSKTHSQSVKVAEPLSESNLPHGSEIDRNDVSMGEKKDDRPTLEISLNNATPAAVEVSPSTSTASSPQQVVKSDVTLSEDKLVSETEPRTPLVPQANNKSNDLPKSSNQNDVDQKVSVDVEILVHQHGGSNQLTESNQCNHDESCKNNAAQKNLVERGRVHDQGGELAEASPNCLYNVDWIGDIDKFVDEKKFFRSCCVNGVVYQVQDYALFRSGNGKLIPFRLQAMWEDCQTSLKWLLVHKCYFPDDLPEEVGRPGAPQSNEVYESTRDSNVVAGFVQGPCDVLPFRKFGEGAARGDQGSQANDRIRPVFIRNWFYDESKRAFCPSAS